MKKLIFSLVIVFFSQLTLIIGNCVGQSWSEQVSGVSSKLYSVSAINNDVAWVCGENGIVLRTTNSGVNWVNVSGNIPTTAVLYNIFGLDANTALTISNVGIVVTIYKTSNGGVSWSTVYTISASGAFGNALWMTDANTAYYFGDPVGGYWHLLKSTNGGDNWTTWSNLAVANNIYGINNGMFFYGASNVWFCNGPSTTSIIYSSNAGLNWVPQVSPSTNSSSVWFNSLSNGMCGGYTGLLGTTNGGMNWTNISSPITSSVLGICGTGTHWWAAGFNPSIIYYSSNGGSNWIPQYSISGGFSHLSRARNGSNIWGIRNDGGISKFLPRVDLLSPLNNSTNNAINLSLEWTKQPIADNYNLVLATDSLFTNIILNDSTLTDTTKYVSGLNNSTKYYWKVRCKIGASWGLFCNFWTFTTIIAAPSGVPSLITPISNSINLSLTPTLDWSDVATSTRYDVMVSTDSLFNTYAVNDSAVLSQYTVPVNKLTFDKKYFWRARGKNIGGAGPWSTIWNFRTILGLPNIDTLIRYNKSITINWSQIPPNSNIVKFRIYRGLSSPASTLIDSVAGSQFTYTNLNLSNGTTYYYRIKAVNNLNIESDFSNEKYASPYNIKPTARTLTSIFNSDAGRQITQNYTFTSSGSSDPDGTIDSVQWFINYNKVSSDTSLTYAFPQGTTFLKLLVIDNDGARDSSTTIVTRSVFRKYLGGPVYAGLSLIGDSVMYAIASNDKVYRMDVNGNIIYNLSVNGNILASSSISGDTSVFIGSSDNNLYGFSRYGSPLWPVLPLGGQITATPTLDSATNRIYIGISNGFLQVVSRSTGTIAWSSFVGSAVQGSAVITLDRKLVLFNVKGDMYGFNLNSSNTTATWFLISSDSVKTSPAIDNSGNVYVGTRGGKLKKITLPTGQQGNVVWESTLGSPVNTSPVIDAAGNVYVGLQNGQFVKVNGNTGATIWTFNSSASINTSPSLSRTNRVYFGNTNGEIVALDSNKSVMWYYKDSASIGNALLYHKGTVYAGTTVGRVIAIYDGTPMLDNPGSNPAPPMWGTYQGNNRRTGSMYDVSIGIMQTGIEIPKDYFVGNNYPNPFNPMTRIKYGLPKEGNVKLVIYDMLGREVKVIINETQKPGVYEATFDASSFPSGVYFYRIVTNNFVKTRRMVLVK